MRNERLDAVRRDARSEEWFHGFDSSTQVLMVLKSNPHHHENFFPAHLYRTYGFALLDQRGVSINLS